MQAETLTTGDSFRISWNGATKDLVPIAGTATGAKCVCYYYFPRAPAFLGRSRACSAEDLVPPGFWWRLSRACFTTMMFHVPGSSCLGVHY